MGQEDKDFLCSQTSKESYRVGQSLEQWLKASFSKEYPIAEDSVMQHGVVHRLDVDTSGALLWAKTYTGYFLSQLQFAARRVRKEYVCLCHGWLPTAPRVLQYPLGNAHSLVNNMTLSIVMTGGKNACTEVMAVGHLECSEGLKYSLVQLRLHTGRRHQIRAHFAHEGHPLVGDISYGSASSARQWCPRIFLHAYYLELDMGHGAVNTGCPLPPDLVDALAQVRAVNETSRGLWEMWLRQG